MRVCDRCEGKEDVAQASLGLRFRGGGGVEGAEVDLCAECRRTLRLLVLVPNYAAVGILQVLDGEPPADVREADKRATEASEEVPFDPALIRTADAWSARWERVALGTEAWSEKAVRRASSIYRHAFLRTGRSDTAAAVATASLPQTDWKQKVKSMQLVAWEPSA